MKFFLFFVIATTLAFENCKNFGNYQIEWTLNSSFNIHIQTTFRNVTGKGYVSIGFNSKGNTMNGNGNAIIGYGNEIHEYMMIGFMAPIKIPSQIFNETIQFNGTIAILEFVRPLRLLSDEVYFQLENETSTLMFAVNDNVNPTSPTNIQTHTRTFKSEINWTKEGKFIGWKLNFFAVGCNI
jgi:hypothetical protein